MVRLPKEKYPNWETDRDDITPSQECPSMVYRPARLTNILQLIYEKSGTVFVEMGSAVVGPLLYLNQRSCGLWKLVLWHARNEDGTVIAQRDDSDLLNSVFHPLSKEPEELFDRRSAPSHAESDAKKNVATIQNLTVHCDRLLMRGAPSSIGRASYLPETSLERKRDIVRMLCDSYVAVQASISLPSPTRMPEQLLPPKL